MRVRERESLSRGDQHQIYIYIYTKVSNTRKYSQGFNSHGNACGNVSVSTIYLRARRALSCNRRLPCKRRRCTW